MFPRKEAMRKCGIREMGQQNGKKRGAMEAAWLC